MSNDTRIVIILVIAAILAEPNNAWDGTGTEPNNIGWTSEGKVPVVIANPSGGQIGPLSYAGTVYDIAGRVRHSVTLDDAGYEQVTTYEYDIAGKQTAVIDPLGHTLSWTAGCELHDGLNAQVINLSSLAFDGSHRTDTKYDGTRRWKVTDAANNTTYFQYDALGRVITTQYPPTVVYEGGVSPVPTYSHVGYDGLGRKIWESQVTDEGEQANLDDSDGLKWFEYDTAGRLVKVTLPEVTGGEPVYRYIYDEYGNQVGIIDAEGRLTVFEYDELHRQVAKYMPFAPTEPIAADIDTAAEVYTALDNAPTTPAAEYTDYDEPGRIKRHSDYKKQDVGYFYNALGQFKYKKYYEFVDVAPADGENDNYPDNPAETIEYTYDSLGRKDTVYKNGLSVEQYSYDAEGHILSVTTPEGTIVYSYDPITGGKINTSSDNTSVDYYNDSLGRLETAHLVVRNQQTASEQSDYTYNAVGSRQSLTYANGNYTYYVYDAMNHLTRLTNFEQFESNPQSPVGNTLSSFEYKLYADGMRQSATENILPKDGIPGTTPLKSQTVSYTYDNLNRLILEDADDGGTNGYSVEYEYDLVGNRLSRAVWFDHRADELYTEYEHNDKDQLIRETHSDTIPSARLDHPDGSYYAYAGTNVGVFYTKANSNVRIGQFKAWLLGLPSSVSHWLFGLVIVMLVVAFFVPALIQILARIRGRQPTRMPLSLSHRCLSVLLAYVMLISPAGFEQLANASVQYSQLGVSSWGAAGDVFSYCYDANGSLVYKFYGDVPVETSTPQQIISTYTTIAYEHHIYNLQNRLYRIEKYDTTHTITDVTEYRYNDQGIRITKIEDPDGSPVTTTYLVDSYNHTGYAQTLEETRSGVLKTFTIADDMITETVDSGAAKHLLYDGHGSTRQLVSGSVGSTSIIDDFSYDGYGVLLQNESSAQSNPGKTPAQATSLLYAGEHFDSDSQQYYNRARWYNPLNGRFNRVDPYSGNTQDPQSLHKYLYCHANPINGIDPSGMFSLSEINISMVIQASLFLINFYGFIHHATNFGFSMIGVYNAIVQGDFWDFLGYSVVGLLSAFGAFVSFLGMCAATSAPPPGLAGAAISVMGSGGVQAAWQTIISNPALAEWVIMTVGPAAMNTYCFMSKNTKAGLESDISQGGSAEEHHKIPYGNQKYPFYKHPLFKKAGWTKEILEKDPRNKMLLCNHHGRHSGQYLREILKMADDKYAAIGNGGKAAAEKAVKEMLDDIELRIKNGTLKPYINKDVWTQ